MKKSPDKKLIFYTSNTPNGLKISIFLHEAQLAHSKIYLDLSTGVQRSPEYLAINPNGKIPAIVDNEEDMTVFESGAILTYLDDKYKVFKSASMKENLSIQQWLNFQIAGVGPMMGQLWWFLHGSKTQNLEAITRYTNESLRLLGVIERQLTITPYLAGNHYSIADIATFSWLRTWEELNLDLTTFPYVIEWLDKINQRPAVKKAILANCQPKNEEILA
ncbi:TPA: glutathione S-transferase N-terminal domain-containing protein [Proteus mirabilis]